MFPSHDTIREASDGARADSAPRQQVVNIQLVSWKKNLFSHKMYKKSYNRWCGPHSVPIWTLWCQSEITRRDRKLTGSLNPQKNCSRSSMRHRTIYLERKTLSSTENLSHSKKKGKNTSLWTDRGRTARKTETCSSVFLKEQQLKLCFLYRVIDTLVISNPTPGLVSLKCSWSSRRWLKALKF